EARAVEARADQGGPKADRAAPGGGEAKAAGARDGDPPPQDDPRRRDRAHEGPGARPDTHQPPLPHGQHLRAHLREERLSTGEPPGRRREPEGQDPRAGPQEASRAEEGGAAALILSSAPVMPPVIAHR